MSTGLLPTPPSTVLDGWARWATFKLHSEDMRTMEKLTLTLHKTKDTKNKAVYGT